MQAWQRIRNTVQSQHAAFVQALDHAAESQSIVLQQILQANVNSEYGRRFAFSAIVNSEQFRQQVPISKYTEVSSAIDRIYQGEADVLFGGQPVAFEQTGGSSAGVKLIPYTAASRKSFQDAVLPWLADLIEHRPFMIKGRAYFAISPVTRQQAHSATGIPVGMPDGAYMGEALLQDFMEISVTPPHLLYEQDLQRWRFITLCHLAAASDLSLVSVWSPSFFTVLLDELRQHRDEVIAAIHHGYDDGVYAIAQNKTRARLLGAAITSERIDTECLWPQLDVISCWTDGFSAIAAQTLRRMFPHVNIQGKGLLATEGVVTIPWHDAAYPVLALNSGYYEFVDADNTLHEFNQLRENEYYRVIMTTPGGLYRYDLGDYVRCRGFYHQAPMLEFVGRASMVSDQVGEKLVEEFVARCLPSDRGFMQLAPRQDQPGYLLVLDAQQNTTPQAIELAEQVETRLHDNPQYAYARAVGQLNPVQAMCLAKPEMIYRQWALARGQRLGDIKPLALLCDAECYAHCSMDSVNLIEEPAMQPRYKERAR